MTAEAPNGSRRTDRPERIAPNAGERKTRGGAERVLQAAQCSSPAVASDNDPLVGVVCCAARARGLVCCDAQQPA